MIMTSWTAPAMRMTSPVISAAMISFRVLMLEILRSLRPYRPDVSMSPEAAVIDVGPTLAQDGHRTPIATYSGFKSHAK